MIDINYIKDRYCQFKCLYKGDNGQISLGKLDYEFDCDECGESNDIEIEQFTDNMCEYCQINRFIEDIRSYGVKI